MKDLKKFLLTFVVILTTIVSGWSCSDDDKDEPIQYNKLPVAAQTFISTYFPAQKAARVEKDKNSYDVYLDNGTNVEFDLEGNWTDVDAPAGIAVPWSIVPEAIKTFINEKYPQQGVSEISRDSTGYDVELTGGTELEFAPDGTFIRIDY